MYFTYELNLLFFIVFLFSMGKYSDSFTALLKMFTSSNNSSGDFMKQFELMSAMYQYQTYSVLRFMNIHLTYLNSMS